MRLIYNFYKHYFTFNKKRTSKVESQNAVFLHLKIKCLSKNNIAENKQLHQTNRPSIVRNAIKDMEESGIVKAMFFCSCSDGSMFRLKV